MSDQRLAASQAPLFEGSLIEATREHDLAIELLQQEALYVEIFGAMTEPTLLLDERGVVHDCWSAARSSWSDARSRRGLRSCSASTVAASGSKRARCCPARGTRAPRKRRWACVDSTARRSG
jgi:hypothetical protein